MTASHIESEDDHVRGCAGDVEDEEYDAERDVWDDGGYAPEGGSSGWVWG